MHPCSMSEGLKEMVHILSLSVYVGGEQWNTPCQMSNIILMVHP